MTDKLLDRLKQVDPVDADAIRNRPAPPDRLAEILRTEQVAEPIPRRRTPLPGPARMIPAAGALAGAIVVLASLLPGEQSLSPKAVSALESVAATAAAAEAPASNGYDYFRVRSITVATVASTPGYSWFEPTTTEQWVAADGSGRVRRIDHPGEWPGPRDKRRWQGTGHPAPPSQTSVSDRIVGAGKLNGIPYEGALPPVRDLPADPDQLHEIFQRERDESSSSSP